MFCPGDKYSYELIQNILITPEQLEKLDFDTAYDIALSLHSHGYINKDNDSEYCDNNTVIEKLEELEVVG